MAMSLILTLSQTTNFRLFQTKEFAVKLAESSPNRQKTLWEKEKLLVTSNFSFYRGVFKRRDQGLFGKGLPLYQMTVFQTSQNWKHLQATKQM